MTGGWENLLPLVAIVLLIVAGAPLLWLSNRWIEQRWSAPGMPRSLPSLRVRTARKG